MVSLKESVLKLGIAAKDYYKQIYIYIYIHASEWHFLNQYSF